MAPIKVIGHHNCSPFSSRIDGLASPKTMSGIISRRQFLRHGTLTLGAATQAGMALWSRSTLVSANPDLAQPLFDGSSLAGWTPKPRGPIPRLPDLPPPKLAEDQLAR